MARIETSANRSAVSDASPPSSDQSMVADYTEAVVPPHAKRSNFRMFLLFMSMQLVFGAVLVGYGARFQGLTLQQLSQALGLRNGGTPRQQSPRPR